MSDTYDFGLPLKQNFVEYIYYQGFFLPHEVERIRSMWKKEETIKATLSGEEMHNDSIRKSSVMHIENKSENKWIYEKMAMLAISSNNERFWFDLLGFHESLQLTKYVEKDFFEWHLDFGAGEISSRKLSLTVQLSNPDEYEGGELQFMINNKIITAPKERGTVIIFPSFIMHRVTPITKGTRQSIVGWVSGPPYR